MLNQSLNGKWQLRQSGTDEWLPAVVPGGVHTDLLATGRIPDPFKSDNEIHVQWVAEADWTYSRTFQVGRDLLDHDRVELVCDGLDTLAELYLNGSHLGSAENAFRQYRWQVKPLLKPGENELIVIFSSPVRFCAARQEQRPLTQVEEGLPGSPYLRKAPCQFGWDWGPKLPSVGIWRDIGLEASNVARLEDVHIRQLHQQGHVNLELWIKANCWGKPSLKALVALNDPGGQSIQFEDRLVDGNVRITIPIQDPQLWWPNGYGPQPLYQVVVSLVTGETVLDQRKFQIGLRNLELHQEPDEWGRSFTFIVNGLPIFAKGANWIPSDSFPTRISPEHLEHLIHSAALANQNMLRCWGGGHYEEEVFFDLCDRYGILVWQDFMFSCSIYPFTDSQFVENVRQEVLYNVRRLRHRACLALWCGNNEMEVGWTNWGWNRSEYADLKEADKTFFYKTLPAWVRDEDPDHAYWPSSPSSGLPHEVPDSIATGDRHLWEVWHANKPFHFYLEQFPRFASEFGFQSLPDLQTVAAYAEPDEWNMTSYIMEHHQRNRAGNSKIINYLTDHFKLPGDFPSLVYATQVLQAEAMRIAVEHWRRNRKRCSGTLYWQLNDCWPVASWSSIDYYGHWKALHYAARRFYNPLLLSINDESSRMGIFITNDLPGIWQGEVKWSLESLSGKVLDSGLQAVTAAPLETSPFLDLDFSAQLDANDIRDLVFIVELLQAGKCLQRKVALFVPTKHLKTSPDPINFLVTLVGDKLEYTLQATTLARFVELRLEGTEVVFSDNYFDLPAGRTATVTCPLPHGWDLAHAKQCTKVHSLV